MKKALILTFVASAAALSAIAQTSSGTKTGGTSGGTTTGGTTGSSTGTTGTTTRPGVGQTGTSQQTQGFELPRVIFLSGKVLMDDGTPVSSSVVIQRICNGTPQSVAYTDSKGHFSFQWGQTNSMMIDASQPGFATSSVGGFGTGGSAGGAGILGGGSNGPSMAGCELRAELAGYRSDNVNLFNRQSLDNPDIGTIVLHRMGNVEGVSISATSYMAPKDAKKAYEKGLQLMLKNKPEDAAKEFEKAVATYPQYADAWVNIGKIRVSQKNAAGGKEALLKAIEADGKLVAPHIELGMMAAREAKWDEAAPYLDRGLKLDPVDFPQAWYVSAVANYNLKKWDLAEKNVREAQKLDPKHRNPRSDYLLGVILIEKQEYPGAAEQLKSYLKYSPSAPDTTAVKDQIGQIEKFLSDKVEAAKQ